jgi:hypothetical protein
VSQTTAKVPGDQSHLPFWKRSHYLDRMTMRDLVAAYFQHYTIIAYLTVVALCIVGFVMWPATLWQTAPSIGAAALAFTLVVWHEWGERARFSSRAFAVLWTGIVLSAAFPFALGMAFALLSSFDIFSVWFLALLIIGFAYVSRLSKAKSAAIIISLWICVLLLKLIGPAMQALRAAK